MSYNWKFNKFKLLLRSKQNCMLVHFGLDGHISPHLQYSFPLFIHLQMCRTLGFEPILLSLGFCEFWPLYLAGSSPSLILPSLSLWCIFTT